MSENSHDYFLLLKMVSITRKVAELANPNKAARALAAT